MERKIIIGLVMSTDFIKQIQNIWDQKFIESVVAKRIATWVWEYFNKYNKAPGKEIETIFYSKFDSLPEEVAKEIEEDILPSLSEEFAEEGINLQYLLDETQNHFKKKHLDLLAQDIQALIDAGKLQEAEKLACDYKPLANASTADLDFTKDVLLDRIDQAFIFTNKPVLIFQNALGDFMNEQLIKGGLVAFLASEKRGKSFLLLEFALRACEQKKKVAFFQAGDMTENQQLIRICIRLAAQSNKARYCGIQWEPLKDCIKNQANTCQKEERVCNFGPFEDRTEDAIRMGLPFFELQEACKDYPDYKPCTNCPAYRKNKWGTPWLNETDPFGGEPLKVSEAKHNAEEFFIKNERKLKLSSHANNTLSVKQIRAVLEVWEKQDGFVPDMIVIDYADLLVGEAKDFRHLQNEIWKDLRRLSQEKGQPLVITATQADAKSYEADKLKLTNFSEDKRKYAHVTAFYGLNQDKLGREKQIGILRINELLLREGDFGVGNQVFILQNLGRGKAFLGSYL